MRPFIKLIGTLMVAVTASLGQSTISSSHLATSQTATGITVETQTATNQSTGQTTVVSTTGMTGTSSVGMIYCYACTSDSSASFCANATNINSTKPCGKGGVCQVREYENGSFYNVTRGCVEESSCDKASFDGRSCKTISNMKTCLSCCTSDRCNAAQMLTSTPMISALLLFWAACMFISISHSVTFWPCLLYSAW